MTGVNVAAILVAALVSAVVAPGLEWAAKPRLEARKERILRRYRATDDVWRRLNDILFMGRMLKTAGPSDLGEDIRAAADGIVPATQALEEAFREVMPITRPEITGVLGSYVGFVRGVMASDRTWQEKGDLLFTWTPKIMDVLGGPGQRPLYRFRCRYRARQLCDLKAFLES